MPKSRVQIEQRYWNRVRIFTLILLVFWGVFTFGLLWFARDLDGDLLGWPIGFWLAAQGGMLIYLLIVVLYAWVMHKMDRSASQEMSVFSNKPCSAHKAPPRGFRP